MSTPLSAARDSLDGFRGWLHHELSKSSDVGYTRIDFGMSLRELGLSSIHVVRLCGEIEKVLDLELEATLLFDYPSIDAMCDALWRMRANRAARADLAAFRLPIRIAATFTAEPVEEPIRHLLGRLGHDPDVQFARYNQVFQELVTPGSRFDQATAGVNVILFRLEDAFRYAADVSTEAVGRAVADLEGALGGFVARSRAPLVLAFAPHTPAAVRRLGLSEHLHGLTGRLADHARGLGVHVLDLRRLEERFPMARVLDDARDRLGHLPFTPSAYAALGSAIARTVAALVTPPAKVLVVDCDNTLWGGVAGEDGPHGVRVDGPWAAIQAFLVAQQASGKLLCLCSKNEEADVWRVFEANPGMPLRREHVVAWRINWERKSENLRALAAELGLGLDTFVFLDDSAMECAEVTRALPAVLAVQLPDPARAPAFLAHHWAFDAARVTDEDRRRTEAMRENREREAMRAEAPTFADFLAQLALEVDVGPVGEDEWARAAQLTHRTNQFNANKVVRSEPELKALAAAPGRFLARVRVRDRFGDYGMVGLVGAVADGRRMACDTFLLSCRVLGRRVEHAMVGAVVDAARSAGCDEVAIAFVKAPRNEVARAFFDGLGLAPTGEDRGEVRLRVADAERVLAEAGDASGSGSGTARTPTATSRCASAGPSGGPR